MSTTTEDVAASYNKWLRLVVAVHFSGKDLCNTILYFYEKFPSDEKELFQSLLTYQKIFKEKLEEKIITQADYEKIYPKNGKTNSNLFDILLFTLVLEVLFGEKYKNTCTHLKNMINKIYYEGNVAYTEETFEEKWDEVIKFLYNLDCDISKIRDLKTCPLEGSSQYKETILFVKQVQENTKSFQSFLKTTNDDLQNIKTNLKSTKDDLQDTKTYLKTTNNEVREIKMKMNSIEQKSGQQAEQSKADWLCNHVWEVIYKRPTFTLNDWKRLAKLLEFQEHFGFHDYIIIWEDGEEKKFIKDQLQKVNTTWEQMKKCLHSMNQEKMIAELCKKTNLTKGLDMLIKQHKNRISRETSRKNKHRQYVDLVVAESHIIDRRWRKEIDEKTFHMMKFTIPPSHFRKISMNELVSNSKNVTMVTGIPGIGKTTLCEEIKYQWSNNQLWYGKIDILLTIPCRIMNIYNFSSKKELMKHLLPDLQDIELFNEISDRVLLLLDGADEFQHIEELSANPTRPNLQFFKDTIDLPKQQLLSKLIITSRPKIAAFLRRFYEEDIACDVQPVEICGFNDENIRSFIEKQFQDESVVNTVMQKVNETNTMKAMCSVPIFLKSFCTVYKEDSQIMTPSTMTELLLYTLLTFFKELFNVNGDRQKSELSLEQLSADDEVLKHIINLCRLSEKTLAERKVVFFEEDFDSDILNELGKVGFLSKRRHEVKGFAHEYKHLVFQECTAALRILSADPESKREHYHNPNFRDTLPLVSGLEGILKRSNVPKYLKSLVQNVTGFVLVESLHVKSFMEEQLKFDDDFLFNEDLFENTYVFAQSEFMEIPTEEFISQVLTQQVFDLKERTVVTSHLIRFLSFVHPYVEFFDSVLLKIHSSDDMQQLVNISQKAKTLYLDFNKDEKWMEYFKKLSQPSESFCVEKLKINNTMCSLNLDINVENFYFLCDIKRVNVLVWHSNFNLFFIEILERLYSTGKQMVLEHLKVTILDDEELHAIGRLFKYVPSIYISEHCNQIIHQYMNKNNNLKVLRFNHFPELSLAKMVSLERVTVRKFSVVVHEHLCNELKKVKYEEERNLKVVKLKFDEYTSKDKIVDFINSLNFVSDVSRDDCNSVIITI